MEHEISPPRHETAAAIERILSFFHPTAGPRSNGLSQDWDLTFADASRIEAFLDHYESGALDTDEKFALMKLIVASVDDAMATLGAGPAALTSIARFERLLRRDFVIHLHTADHWRARDALDEEMQFAVTPLIRSVWGDCFRPEYGRWL